MCANNYWYVGIKCLTIILLVIESSDSIDVCTSAACRKASTDVLSFIDPSVDPCKDFYKFTCGGIFKKTYDSKPVSLESMLKKDVNDQTTQMLIKDGDPSETKAIQGLKKFFSACMDEATIDKYGMGSLKRALNLLGGWPVVDGPRWNENNFSVEESLVKLRRMGYNFVQLFNIKTVAGDHRQLRYMVTEPVVEKVEDKDKDNYHDYMVDTATLLGAHKEMAQTELQDTLFFKIKLLHILESEDQFRKTTVKGLQQEFPSINWRRFINNIMHPNKEVNDTSELYVPSTDYLKKLEHLLAETSKRTLANYIVWEAVDDLEPFLSKEFRDLRTRYMYSTFVHEEIEKPEDIARLEYCKTRTQETLRPTYEALYIREHFSHEKLQKAMEVVTAVKKALIEMLTDTELYDEETRNKMLEKAYNVTYIVGAPGKLYGDEILSHVFDERENINTNDFLTLAATLNRQSTNLALKYGIPVNFFNNYYDETLLTNGFYNTYLNTMVIPAATLQGLYFNEKRPLYMNFGTIGTMLAHELIHGFTMQGSNYDVGLHDAALWTDRAISNFHQKSECLIRHADDFEIENSLVRMNGTQLLDENICDFTGVELAYRAYENWMEAHGEEEKLPGLQYTPKQLFWITTASYFCDTITLDNLRDFLEHGETAHPIFRAFNAFNNSMHFGTDFGCPVGSPMNPPDKCQIF